MPESGNSPISNPPPLFSSDGWLLRAVSIPSPNFDDRPFGERVSLLVIHNISLPPGRYGGSEVVDLFLNRLDHGAHAYFAQLTGLRVSAHFFIRRAGELIQFVACDRRAWHAGRSQWRGRGRCNDFSIGVELEGTDEESFTEPQYDELARLTRDLRERYDLADVAGHSDIAPGRKTDPGPHFNWVRYRQSIA
jgi:N-acetyl-anhydromuramoyl-L-alanine amidase